MDLKNIQWSEFSVKELFKIERGNRLTKPNRIKGNTPLVTAGFQNVGVAEHIQNENQKNYSNAITIDMFGNVFYREYEFKCDDNIHVLTNKNITNKNGNFICNCFKQTTENIFSYGKQFRLKTLEKLKIVLPTNSKGEPDYVFMEQFMRQKEQEKIDKFQNYISKRIEQVKDFKATKPLNQLEWGEFEIGKLFKLYSGKSKGLNHLQKSNFGVNYLGATNLNNGVLSYVNPKDNEKMLQKGNCIAFIRNGEGSMGFSIYKAEKFIATSDITVGYSENLNREVGLFMTTIADTIRGKYNFGYKRSETRLKKEKLQLPTDKNGQPDYDYMENYIKKLEYEKLTKYITRKTTNA